jgi:choline dehydrogenase
LTSPTYDYVIVGAGSAGCVVAARLAEDPDVTVCMIEAGPPDDEPAIHMPFAFPLLWRSRFDWDLETEPEPGLGGDRTFIPRGRVLGGSSSLNAMVYIRGNRADYDEWAEMGLAGWGYEDVLPYFIRSEDNERGESHYHGAGGPLTVSDGRSKHPLAAACIEAAVEAGIAPTDDHNAASQDGVGWWQLSQRHGRRCSTAVAYLHPAARRGNLDVLTDTAAARVLLDGRRAIGVEVLRDNRLIPVRATREVILAAGAYQSPALLLLSGIGPADELRAMGIEPRCDLPVGRDLQDHPIVSVIWGTDEPSLRTAMSPESLERFERDGRGPLTSSLTEAGLFVRTRPELEAPDVQALIFPVAVGRNLLDPPAQVDGCSIAPILLKPSSRGRVFLRSALPLSKPRIIHNYLATEEDRRSLIDGVRIALEIGSRPALRRLRKADLAVPQSDSDRDILEFVRRDAHTVFHPVGTCAMGAVVDAQLRVHGIDGLRVVDASVMPTVPRGNTNAPTIMVAEKASDMIRGVAPLPPRPALTDVSGAVRA